MDSSQFSYEIKINGKTGTLGSLFINDADSYEALMSVIKDQVESFPSDTITVVLQPPVKKRTLFW